MVRLQICLIKLQHSAFGFSTEDFLLKLFLQKDFSLSPIFSPNIFFMGETSHLTAAPVLQAFHKGDFLHRGENAAKKNLNQIEVPTLEGKWLARS